MNQNLVVEIVSAQSKRPLKRLVIKFTGENRIDRFAI